jgi:hypothetical protein
MYRKEPHWAFIIRAEEVSASAASQLGLPFFGYKKPLPNSSLLSGNSLVVQHVVFQQSLLSSSTCIFPAIDFSKFNE